MPARAAAPPRQRDVDMNYSNVGGEGRRTGVVLPTRPLDEHGMEGMTGIFSSPKKATPAAERRAIMRSSEVDGRGTTPGAYTPTGSKSARRSIRGASFPAVRSSPRKSGITGSARRIGTVDLLHSQQVQENMQEHQDTMTAQGTENVTPPSTKNLRSSSARPATVRRFSPEKTPLRNRVLNGRMTKSAGVSRISDVQEELATPEAKSILRSSRRTRGSSSHTPSDNNPIPQSPEREADLSLEPALTAESSPPSASKSGSASDPPEAISNEADGILAENEVMDGISDTGEEENDQASVPFDNDDEGEEEAELPPIPVENDNEDDHDFEPEKRVGKRKGQSHKANSRQKRRSDAIEDDIPSISSPSAKRAKRRSEDGLDDDLEPPSRRARSSKPKVARKPLVSKSINKHMSQHRRRELDDVVDKIKSRPGHNKSLIVLRRETPADDAVTHTRSGRVSIKPLAWWRNEGIVWGDSPGGISNGQRFPLNSIKEIIRTEETSQMAKPKPKLKGRARSRGKGKAKSPGMQDDFESSESDIDADSIREYKDPDADDWELDTGTFQGAVSVWDNIQQAPIEEDETIDIAYASVAMQTKAPAGSSFRYARVLSTRFFGSGIVELPPGAIKKPKNSRKMHMGFFVAQGRVNVEVGPVNSAMNRFSIGKGGFWQVPRGNQYSIENKHERLAKVFFSQACDTASEMEE